MKLYLDPKNPRRVLNQDGDFLFEFEGLHLSDLKDILSKVNGYEFPKQI